MRNNGLELRDKGFNLTTLGGEIGGVFNEGDMMVKDKIIYLGFRDEMKRTEERIVVSYRERGDKTPL